MHTSDIKNSNQPLDPQRDYSKSALQQQTLGQSKNIISTLAALPNKQFASGSYDKYIQIWDVESGLRVRSWLAHDQEISALVALKNGFLVSGSYDGIIKVWDPDNGNCMQSWQAHNKHISSIVILDNDQIATGSYDGTIKIWNPLNGQLLGPVLDQKHPVTALALFNKKFLISGSNHGLIKYWQLETRQCIKNIDAHNHKISSFAVLADEQFASGSLDSTIKIWQWDSGKCLRILPNSSWVIALQVLDEKYLANSLQDATIKIWNIETGECINNLSAHQQIVLGLILLSEGRLISCSADGTIKLWQFPLRTIPQEQFEIPHLSLPSTPPKQIPLQEPISSERLTLSVISPAVTERAASAESPTKNASTSAPSLNTLSPTSVMNLDPRHEKAQKYLAAGFLGKALKVYQKLAEKNDVVATQKVNEIKKLLQQFKQSHTSDASTFSKISAVNKIITSPSAHIPETALQRIPAKLSEPFVTPITPWLKFNEEIRSFTLLNNEQLVSASPHEIFIMDLLHNRCSYIFHDEQEINCLFISPAGRIVSGSGKYIKLWDLTKKKCMKILAGHNKPIWALTGLPKGLLVSGAQDNLIKIWQPGNQQNSFIRDLVGHTNWITCLTALRDARLVSGSMDCTIKIWQPDTGVCISTLTEHESYIFTLTALPDGRFASGSNDNTIKIWHPDSKRSLLTLKGHTACVQVLAVVAKDVLASASYDNTIKLWDLNTGHCLKTIPAHRAPIRALTIWRNDTLISGSLDCIIHFWKILLQYSPEQQQIVTPLRPPTTPAALVGKFSGSPLTNTSANDSERNAVAIQRHDDVNMADEGEEALASNLEGKVSLKRS